MHLSLIAVGTNMPSWVQTGFQDYIKRLPSHWRFQLIEVAAGKRYKGANIARILQDENDRLLNAIPKNNYVIALDVEGKQWSTSQLAQHLQHFEKDGQDISLLIGGPEGMTTECLARANEKWSLSALTFPHPLVRIILAEQLYRAYSLSQGHPYHRE